MSYNLLLVDDDCEFRSEFCECFNSYEITQAAEGETALNILKKPNSIDLVLLDILMPGLAGTQVLTEMKKLKPDVKIVMLTANRSKDVVIDALKGRADDYIEKPMNVDETRAIIERLIGEKESAGCPDTGNVQAKIDRVKRFVERNYDKKVSLADASAHAGLNPKYLSMIFEQRTGMGFSEFKSRYKVKKAIEMLKQGFNVNQISDKLAYAKTDSFIRLFKKITGSTPALYRNKKLLPKKSAAARKITRRSRAGGK